MECPICYTCIDERDQIKLKCGHTFHRFCLCESYKIEKSRQCPYCRNPYNPLQLNDGEQFTKGFHKQNIVVKKNVCTTILQSGKRKGEQCNVILLNGMVCCKRHEKKKT